MTQPLFQADTVAGTPVLPINGGAITDPTQLQNTLQIRKRAWEKDYFTSAQTSSQLGNDVQIPIEGLQVNYKKPSDIRQTSDDELAPSGVLTSDPLDAGKLIVDGAVDTDAYIDNIDSISGYSLTVNELRTTVRLQEWFEKNARAGYRYIEQILSHFGVKSSDARLQRAEYLGGGKVPVKISEVLSTFDDGATATLGEMAGHGIAFGQSNRFNKSFEEHGVLIGVMSIMPRTAYQDGLPRILTARDTWDKYYWPEFAHLGEQEIKLSELYFDPNQVDAANDATFGYQSRYCEYKYGISTVHGDFRNSLDVWHMGRKFSAAPSLNAAFVEADPTTRVFNVTDTGVDKVYCHILNKVDAIRPMPYFGIPTI